MNLHHHHHHHHRRGESIRKRKLSVSSRCDWAWGMSRGRRNGLFSSGLVRRRWRGGGRGGRMRWGDRPIPSVRLYHACAYIHACVHASVQSTKEETSSDDNRIRYFRNPPSSSPSFPTFFLSLFLLCLLHDIHTLSRCIALQSSSSFFRFRPETTKVCLGRESWVMVVFC